MNKTWSFIYLLCFPVSVVFGGEFVYRLPFAVEPSQITITGSGAKVLALYVAKKHTASDTLPMEIEQSILAATPAALTKGCENLFSGGNHLKLRLLAAQSSSDPSKERLLFAYSCGESRMVDERIGVVTFTQKDALLSIVELAIEQERTHLTRFLNGKSE
jgi:hypothetical protein